MIVTEALLEPRRGESLRGTATRPSRAKAEKEKQRRKIKATQICFMIPRSEWSRPHPEKTSLRKPFLDRRENLQVENSQTVEENGQGNQTKGNGDLHPGGEIDPAVGELAQKIGIKTI